MSQVGHIFAKDTRHLKWEIVIAIALTAGFAWFYPYNFMPHSWIEQRHAAYPETLAVVGGFLISLAPVAWWVLMTRLVQSENLVGDRQWWVTKPYEWGNLLTAKLLFVGAFVVVPLFVAELAMLAIGGFRPFEHLPSLGFNLLLTISVIILPLIAIATITSSFGRTTLTLLGIAVAMVALVTVLSLFTHGYAFAASIGWWVDLTILVCGLVAAIVLQYAQRRVWVARGVLVLTVVLLGVAMCLASTSVEIAMEYPRGDAPLQMTYDAGTPMKTLTQNTGNHFVGVSVPVKIAGIAQDALVNLDSVQINAVAPDGNHWTSGWMGLWGARYDNSDTSAMLPLQLDEDFYEKEKSQALTLHLRFAVSRLRRAGQMAMALPTSDFAVPHFGICSPNDYLHNGEIADLTCRAAVRQPQLTLIAVKWSEVRCADHASLSSPVVGEGWAGEVSPAPAEFGLSPVFPLNFALSNGAKPNGQGGNDGARHMCPGAPISFTRFDLAGRSEFDVTLDGYHPPASPLTVTQP